MSEGVWRSEIIFFPAIDPFFSERFLSLMDHLVCASTLYGMHLDDNLCTGALHSETLGRTGQEGCVGSPEGGAGLRPLFNPKMY